MSGGWRKLAYIIERLRLLVYCHISYRTKQSRTKF